MTTVFVFTLTHSMFVHFCITHSLQLPAVLMKSIEANMDFNLV